MESYAKYIQKTTKTHNVLTKTVMRFILITTYSVILTLYIIIIRIYKIKEKNHEYFS